MHTRIAGRLFNGQNAVHSEAVLVVSGQRFSFETFTNFLGPNGDVHELRISARLGSIPRVIETTRGVRFETVDFPGVESLEAALNQTQIVHRLERSWRAVLPIAASLVVALLFFYKVVIPHYAALFAPMIPDSVREQISKPIEEYLKNTLVTDAKALSAEQSARLYEAVDELKRVFPNKKINVQLFNEGAPNAFVIPNGHIYVTIGMVKFAKSSDELLAVLLHEMGHQVHHHVMQSLLANSAISVLIIGISGGTEWTNVPILLLNNTYSRANESIADMYSINKMKELGKSPEPLADLFERLQKSGEFVGVPTILSTHPGFTDRIESIRNSR